VVLKTLSIHSTGALSNLIRYIMRDEKTLQKANNAERDGIPASVRVTSQDLQYLQQEKGDGIILEEFHKFKGSMEDFVKEVLMKNPSFIGRNEDKKEAPIVIKHNVRGNSVGAYIDEFNFNERFRIHQRSNSVLAYHNILSFSNLSTKHLTEDIIRDLANKFISFHDKSLVVGAFHIDKSHQHIHLISSGVQYLTGQVDRQTKAEYEKMKISIQEYQKGKYPELNDSIVDHQKGSRSPEKNKNSERFSEKQNLLEVLTTSYAKAESLEHFLSDIKIQGFEPYFRNGRLTGVEGDRKYRFSRLGFEKEKLEQLDIQKQKIDKEIEALANIRSGKSRERELDNREDEVQERTVSIDTDENTDNDDGISTTSEDSNSNEVIDNDEHQELEDPTESENDNEESENYN